MFENVQTFFYDSEWLNFASEQLQAAILLEILFLAALVASLLSSSRILFLLCFAGTSWFRFHIFADFSLIGNHLFLPHAVFAFVPGIPMLSGELLLCFFSIQQFLALFFFCFFIIAA